MWQWFVLAEKMGRPVGELMQDMTASEFMHWVAYHKILHDEEQKVRQKYDKKEQPVTNKDGLQQFRARKGI